MVKRIQKVLREQQYLFDSHMLKNEATIWYRPGKSVLLKLSIIDFSSGCSGADLAGSSDFLPFELSPVT